MAQGLGMALKGRCSHEGTDHRHISIYVYGTDRSLSLLPQTSFQQSEAYCCPTVRRVKHHQAERAAPSDTHPVQTGHLPPVHTRGGQVPSGKSRTVVLPRMDSGGPASDQAQVSDGAASEPPALWAQGILCALKRPLHD